MIIGSLSYLHNRYVACNNLTVHWDLIVVTANLTLELDALDVGSLDVPLDDNGCIVALPDAKIDVETKKDALDAETETETRSLTVTNESWSFVRAKRSAHLNSDMLRGRAKCERHCRDAWSTADFMSMLWREHNHVRLFMSCPWFMLRS